MVVTLNDNPTLPPLKDRQQPPDGPTEAIVQPTRPVDSMAPYEEARLIVAGMEFYDWESVWVELEFHGEYSYFRFTSVERDNPGIFYKLQFMPGEMCTVVLGGTTVLTGIIENRQVAYDAHRHGIEISGKSFTAPIARSSVNTKTGSFDGMTFQQVAEKVLSPFPVRAIPIGALNATPFDKLQNQPGEPIWDFLERIARPRGIILGSDSFGNFLLIGKHGNPVLNTQLIEGQNIKKCQVVFEKKYTWQQYKVIAQHAASNDQSGTAASELEASWGGSGVLGSVLITPAEQPVKSIAEVQDRARNEALWNEGTVITMTATVQGWYRDERNLWWPGDNVYVYSPMAPLDLVMKIEKVIFSQDSANGTETVLELKQPWALNDNNQMNTANPTATNAPQVVTKPVAPVP
jgi:prophage tail gpP-like protein